MSALGHDEILARQGEIFGEGGLAASDVRAAKYWLRLSGSYLILPNGRRYTPDGPCASRFVVEPGQTAFVSTVERITMPADLIGLIGPRFANAEHGILFFGGMIVDPGYGLLEPGGEPLSFYIANVGARSLELRPEDRIASIAFLRVEGGPDTEQLTSDPFKVKAPKEIREEMFDPKAPKRRPQSLALIEDVRTLRDQVEKIDTSLNQIVMFGIIVLAITFLAAVTSNLLAMGSNQGGDISLFGDSGKSGTPWIGIAWTMGIAIVATGMLVLVLYFARWAGSTGLRRWRSRSISGRDY